jgi:hypothetical protein
MTSRIAAAIFGLIAGIAVFFTVTFNFAGVAGFLHAGHIGIVMASVSGVTRAAWAISGGITAFAVVASLAALITGMAETAKVRARIDELRLDPAMAGQWNAADWRAAFAPTAIADQAEAMIAILPVEKDDERRVVVDVPLLLGLNRIWLDRLTLAWTIEPLPAILLGLAATLALVAYDVGDKWDAALAAGTAGWFTINLVRYLVRAALAPLVDSAVAAATAAIRPLSSVHALEAHRQIVQAPVPAKRIEQEEAEIIAAALSNAIWEPLGRLADATEKLTNTTRPLTRDQEIEAALAGVRAGIEKLLNNSGG